MKTANVNGQAMDITYKTNTEMYTKLTNPLTRKSGQYGADIYSIDDDNNHLVLVATAHNGSTLKATTTVVTSEQYSELSDLYDPYNAGKYHLAIMSVMGFE